MRQKPSRLVSDLQNSVQLVSRNALLAARHQIGCLEHLVERHPRVFENRANLHRELLATLTALFQAVAKRALWAFLRRLTANARQIVNPTTDNSTVRTYRFGTPDNAFEIFKSLCFVVEIRFR